MDSCLEMRHISLDATPLKLMTGMIVIEQRLPINNISASTTKFHLFQLIVKKIFGATIPIPKHVEEVATTFEIKSYILNGIRFG